MNQRDSKIVYDFKNQLIDKIRDSLPLHKSRDIAIKLINAAAEEFLHPPEDVSGFTLKPDLEAGYFSLDALMGLKGFKTVAAFQEQYTVYYRRFSDNKTLYSARKKAGGKNL